jgi:hypothetical protein
MGSIGRLDVERLLWVVLVVVLALLVLELADAIASLTQGIFSRSLIALLIAVLIALWYLDTG